MSGFNKFVFCSLMLFCVVAPGLINWVMTPKSYSTQGIGQYKSLDEANRRVLELDFKVWQLEYKHKGAALSLASSLCGASLVLFGLAGRIKRDKQESDNT